MLEIFAERGLIGEIKLIGYLLHILARKPKQIFCLEYHILVNPFRRTASGALLYYKRQMFG